MIIGFETGKLFNDRIIDGFVNKIDRAVYQTYMRKHVQKQYKDDMIVHNNLYQKM